MKTDLTKLDLANLKLMSTYCMIVKQALEEGDETTAKRYFKSVQALKLELNQSVREDIETKLLKIA